MSISRALALIYLRRLTNYTWEKEGCALYNWAHCSARDISPKLNSVDVTNCDTYKSCRESFQREVYIYISRRASQNYKNDAAIVNLCSHEFIVAVPEIFERGCAISAHRDVFQDYGDWRAILIRDIFTRDPWKGRSVDARKIEMRQVGAREKGNDKSVTYLGRV